MNTNLIRWTKDDRTNLRKAVNNFNAKVRRLERQGKTNLPDLVSYKELVGLKKLQENEVDNTIYSRRELNNVIRSLQRFTRRGSEEVVTLKSGETLTKWSRNELRIQKSRAIRNLNKRIGDIDTTFGMGNKEIQELEGMKETIQNIDKQKGYEFRRIKNMIERNARADRDLRLANMWKENYLKRIESLQNFDNYDIFREKIESIKNPIKLYEYISQSEVLSDLFLWTKTDEEVNPSTQTFGGFSSDQEAFNLALEKLDII